MASKIKLAPMALAELRALIHTTTADLAALEHAPVPVEEAEANLTAAVERLASLSTPDAVLQGFSRIPPPGIDSVELLLGDPRYDLQSFHAFLLATFGDLLLEGWRARLKELYAADPALNAAAVPSHERPAGVAALHMTLHELEVAEEKLIVAAEKRGERIDRRPDCDPSVLFDPSILLEAAAAPA